MFKILLKAYVFCCCRQAGLGARLPRECNDGAGGVCHVVTHRAGRQPGGPRGAADPDQALPMRASDRVSCFQPSPGQNPGGPFCPRGTQVHLMIGHQQRSFFAKTAVLAFF